MPLAVMGSGCVLLVAVCSSGAGAMVAKVSGFSKRTNLRYMPVAESASRTGHRCRASNAPRTRTPWRTSGVTHMNSRRLSMLLSYSVRCCERNRIWAVDTRLSPSVPDAIRSPDGARFIDFGIFTTQGGCLRATMQWGVDTEGYGVGLRCAAGLIGSRLDMVVK